MRAMPQRGSGETSRAPGTQRLATVRRRPMRGWPTRRPADRRRVSKSPAYFFDAPLGHGEFSQSFRGLRPLPRSCPRLISCGVPPGRDRCRPSTPNDCQRTDAQVLGKRWVGEIEKDATGSHPVRWPHAVPSRRSESPPVVACMTGGAPPKPRPRRSLTAPCQPFCRAVCRGKMTNPPAEILPRLS